MATYYSIIPDSGAPAAEIEAPDSKHARTSYLDYLSRANIIQYNQRGIARKKVITRRMQPGEFQTAIHLDYGEHYEPMIDSAYGEAPEGSYTNWADRKYGPDTTPDAASTSRPPGTTIEEARRQWEAEQEQTPVQQYQSPVPAERPQPQVQVAPVRNPVSSPIGDLARRTGGF